MKHRQPTSIVDVDGSDHAYLENLSGTDSIIDKNNHMADQKSARLTLTLQELEKNFRAAPEVLIALAELEESLSLLEKQILK